jgi:hypothetical protein
MAATPVLPAAPSEEVMLIQKLFARPMQTIVGYADERLNTRAWRSFID